MCSFLLTGLLHLELQNSAENIKSLGYKLQRNKHIKFEHFGPILDPNFEQFVCDSGQIACLVVCVSWKNQFGLP